ncbi:hypothetical protein BGX24_002254 [Mortierella sp. AD032]|nr:hypothetical protein BGX24_002254 [Mortierella sp. AD032]
MNHHNSSSHPIDVDSVRNHKGIFSRDWQAKQSGSELVEALKTSSAIKLSASMETLRDEVKDFAGSLSQMEDWLKRIAQELDPIFSINSSGLPTNPRLLKGKKSTPITMRCYRSSSPLVTKDEAQYLVDMVKDLINKVPKSNNQKKTRTSRRAPRSMSSNGFVSASVIVGASVDSNTAADAITDVDAVTLADADAVAIADADAVAPDSTTIFADNVDTSTITESTKAIKTVVKALVALSELRPVTMASALPTLLSNLPPDVFLALVPIILSSLTHTFTTNPLADTTIAAIDVFSALQDGSHFTDIASMSPSTFSVFIPPKISILSALSPTAIETLIPTVVVGLSDHLDLLETALQRSHVGTNWEPKEADTFRDAETLKKALREWGLSIGFRTAVVSGGRSSIVGCHRGLQPRNAHGISIKKGCPFAVHYSNPKSGTVTISKVVHEHSHPLKSEARDFLLTSADVSPEIRATITIYGNKRFESSTIREILKEHHPNHDFIAPRKLTYLIGKDKTNGAIQVLKDRTQAHELLEALEALQKRDPRWFYKVDIDPKTHRLKGVFWMDPAQRELYRRYPTAEKKADYEWTLRALKDSTTDDIGNAYLPLVILCDEDLGLNAVLKRYFKGVQRFNCLWHIALHNIPKNFRLALRKKYPSFIAQFWRAQMALTEEEFMAL